MKFEIEIDLNYPGIENDTPEMIQYNLQLILERGSASINDENQDVYEESEECTCVGYIVKTKPMVGMLVYYKRVDIPNEYLEPTRSMFDDFILLSDMSDTDNVTYEQFCKMSKKSYEEAKIRGYMLAFHTKAASYKNNEELKKIKDELRLEEGFVGFIGDQAVEDLLTPIKNMLDDEIN